MTSPVWFITGTSTGFGRELALALLERGDRVIATARKITTIEDLKTAGAAIMTLDITSPVLELEKIAQEAIAIFGQVDYLVNNAGYILNSLVEESSPQEIYDQFNTNVFGTLNVTKSFLPHFRSRRSGMIIFNGSSGGWMTYPGVTIYHATKFSLEAIANGLSLEVAHLGIRVLLIEPGHFRTSLLQGASTSSGRTDLKEIDDYASLRELLKSMFGGMDGNQVGDPKLAALRIIDIATSTGMATGKPFPLRVALGSDAVEEMAQVCKDELENLERWKDLSASTDSPNPSTATLKTRDVVKALATIKKNVV